MTHPAWIRSADPTTTTARFVRRFRVVSGHGVVVSATLALSAQGLVEATIDGAPVSDDVLIPGWTAYQERIRVVRRDVTGIVGSPGSRHELALQSAPGWFSGRLGWMGGERLYGDRPGVYADLRIRFADGFEQRVATDHDWAEVRSTVLSGDLYDGQVTDLTVETAERIRGVVVEEVAEGRLAETPGPAIVRHESLAPVSAELRADGSLLLDFGQNLVGWLRVRATGARGHRLVMRHAEVLVDGELATRALRSARAEDILVLSGGEDVHEPTLTFHGFRYAQIDGWSDVDGTVEAVVVGSELRRTGSFASSHPGLNALHRNVVWSLRGNTVGIPTDCPQRDERLGWTGDIAVFAPAACFLFDMTTFLRDWLADLWIEQRANDGRVPYVVPDALPGWTVREGERPEAAALWSDAAVWVPWAAWWASGDRRVLEESYPSVVAHLQRVRGRLSSRGVWEGDFQFGDWLDPTAPPDDPFAALADPDVIATAAFFGSVGLAVRIAVALGRDADAADWQALAARLHESFVEAYVDESGRIMSDAPAVYALSIVTGILDGALERTAGERLAELVRASGHRVIAGFAGAPYLCEALARTGHLDDAYALLLQRESPSWLHTVDLGATTIWERWDSMLDDGSLNPGEMTSFNHYALGAVADWMHTAVAGIRALEPGYARVLLDPRPGGGLEWAQGAIETPHGLVAVRWQLRGGECEAVYCAPEGCEVELGERIRANARRVDESAVRKMLAKGEGP